MELKDVSFSYGDNAVYRNLSITIERGQKVALVGPNGAGKSTLMNVLSGEVQPAIRLPASSPPLTRLCMNASSSAFNDCQPLITA